MKEKMIGESELEPYLEFVRLNRDVQVRLHLMNKHTEQKLKDMKELQTVCKKMSHLKGKFKFKIEDKEVAKQVLKHGRWY